MIELAHTYSPLKGYVNTTWFASPKYDGIRGVYADGKLITRQGTVVLGLEKIESECRDFIAQNSHIPIISLEGELWHPTWEFPKISGVVRDKKNWNQAEKDEIKFKIFLCRSSFTNTQEMASFLQLMLQADYQHISPVFYQEIPNTPKDIYTTLENFKPLSLEGIMLRHPTITFTAGRSHNLVKLKSMQKSQFTIVGFEEGRGKLKGTLGKVRVSGLVNGVLSITSYVGTGFTDNERNYLWQNKNTLLGQDCSIIYMAITNGTSRSLRQPVWDGLLNQ